MKISLFIILVLLHYISYTQTTEQKEDTFWSEPIRMSLLIVLHNAEQVNFLLVNPDVPERQDYNLPEGAALAHSLSEVAEGAYSYGRVYYICLSDYRKDSWTAQLEWRIMTATVNEDTHNMDFQTQRVFSSIYHYDGTNWSAGPSSIQDINQSRPSENK
jgi:hypothetical protein